MKKSIVMKLIEKYLRKRNLFITGRYCDDPLEARLIKHEDEAKELHRRMWELVHDFNKSEDISKLKSRCRDTENALNTLLAYLGLQMKVDREGYGVIYQIEKKVKGAI